MMIVVCFIPVNQHVSIVTVPDTRTELRESRAHSQTTCSHTAENLAPTNENQRSLNPSSSETWIIMTTSDSGATLNPTKGLNAHT